MRVLVVGSGGLLGSAMVRTAIKGRDEVIGTYHSEAPDFDIGLFKFDITDTEQFAEILADVDPDVVVNCAAMTDVDACEKERDKAHEVNGYAPGRLALEADSREIDFVQVSTDYVFAGDTNTRYAEGDECNPAQVYGQSKLEGEQQVLDSHASPLIVRLSFLYGQRGDTGTLTGFPAWLRSQLNSNGQAQLLSDQWITPTRAGQAAETILDLTALDESGLYHVASRSCVTPHEIGKQLVTAMGYEESSLTAGSLNDVERPAKRPSRTCLDVGKVESTLGRRQPTLREDIGQLRDGGLG